MNSLAAHGNSPSPLTGHEDLTPRERKASHIADRRGLALRRSGIRFGNDDTGRYDLVYERYNQPVATDLTLTAIEAWLDIAVTIQDC